MHFYLMFLVNFCLLHVSVSSHSLTGNIDPSVLKEAFLEPTALLNLYGYPGEKHSVTTDDGYILPIHRIPNESPDAIPILLMHGLACSSTQFFINRHTSPAFILADAGFDVWMGNFRGNAYTSHNKYTTQDSEFWNYSWQEMAEQDLPHTIDYVLNATKQSKLILTGHSLGTTVGFALFSTQPSYNNKVAGFFALAPVAFLQYISAIPYKPLPKLLKLLPVIKPRHVGNLDGRKLDFVMELCASKELHFLCKYSYASIDGYDPDISNKIFMNKGMYKYDYREKTNQLLNNSPMPQAYNLSEISVPVVIFYGANDAVANPLDVEILSRNLQNLKAKELVPWPLFAHSDFMIAMNMKELMYDKFILHAKDLWKNSN